MISTRLFEYNLCKNRPTKHLAKLALLKAGSSENLMLTLGHKHLAVAQDMLVDQRLLDSLDIQRYSSRMQEDLGKQICYFF